MKNILMALVLAISSSVFADTTDLREFLYTGANTVEELNLSTEKTRTEYRTVTVPSICYRIVRTRQCTNRRVCDNNGNCRRVRRCFPVTRRVPYNCMRQETRAVQVHDYYVETNVRFEFALANTSDAVRENFNMKMVGERAELTVKGSKNYFVVLDLQRRNESRRAGVKYVDLLYKVRLISANQAKSVLGNGIKNVKLRSGVLTFSLGAGFNLSEFAQQIRIFQNRRLGSDTLLLDKYLSSNETDIQTTNNASNVSIDLNALGVKLPSKMRVILDTSYNLDENKILNRGEIELKANANWVFR